MVGRIMPRSARHDGDKRAITGDGPIHQKKTSPARVAGPCWGECVPRQHGSVDKRHIVARRPVPPADTKTFDVHARGGCPPFAPTPEELKPERRGGARARAEARGALSGTAGSPERDRGATNSSDARVRSPGEDCHASRGRDGREHWQETDDATLHRTEDLPTPGHVCERSGRVLRERAAQIKEPDVVDLVGLLPPPLKIVDDGGPLPKIDLRRKRRILQRGE